MVIIPGQRKVVAALRAGRPVDPVHGQRGKQRSVHNTYFTLPVVFTMISNHYGFVYGAKHNWLVLVVLMLAGALIRVSFVLRHKALVEAAAGAVALGDRRHAARRRDGRRAAAGAARRRRPRGAGADLRRGAGDRRPALQRSATTPRWRTRTCASTPPTEIRAHAQQVYQQAVVLKLMPMNNATQITDAERALLGRWFEAGAPAR